MNFAIENYDGQLFDIWLPVFIALAFVFSALSFVINFREKYEIVEKSNSLRGRNLTTAVSGIGLLSLIY